MPIINPTLPNDGETIDASDVNNPFNAILGVLNGGLDSNNIANGGVTLANLATALTPFLVPTATVMPFAGAAAPTGYLFCDGSSLLRASYPSLFAAISTNYGSVDGTHFNLPDLRGRVTVGREAMGGSTSNRLERTSTISTTGSSATATVGSASNLSVGMFIISANVPAGTTISSISGTTITMSANATTTAAGTTARFSMLGNDPEILGAAGGSDVQTLLGAQLASHQHTFQFSTANSAISGNAGADPARSSTLGSSSGAVYTTDVAGGNQSHPIMPPSLVTNYIIKT